MHDAWPQDEDQAALRYAAAYDAALCTIVGIDGSFSRSLGAQLAVGVSGKLVGSLADGCLDQELASQVYSARQKGESLCLRYGKGSPIIDFRLPCGSGLDILIEPFPVQSGLQKCVADLDLRVPACLPLPCPLVGGLKERRFTPHLRLISFGDTAEAHALEHLSAASGVEFTGIKPGRGISLGVEPSGIEVDPWTAIILLFHDHEWEPAILHWALRAEPFYVGAIGGRAARLNRELALASRGIVPADRARIKSPIGLIPAARHPHSLALGVLAEIVRDYEALRG